MWVSWVWSLSGLANVSIWMKSKLLKFPALGWHYFHIVIIYAKIRNRYPPTLHRLGLTVTEV